MSARSDLPPEDVPISSRRPEGKRPAEQSGTADSSGNRLTAAIAVAGLGAALVGVAPLVGLVSPETSTAFMSWPLLLVLALIPAAAATWAVRRGRPVLAAALLIGPAVLAPGRLVLDAQLVVDAGLAARPELLLPRTLDPLVPATGLWLLLAGHVLTAVAGGLAFAGAGRTPEPSLGAAFGSTEDIPAAGARRQGLLALVLCATVIAAVGLLMTQFESDDPYLLPRAALDSPVVVLIGSLLLAIGVPTAGGLVAGSADPEFARGGLLGIAAALAGVVVPPLFAVALLGDLHYAWGAGFVLIAAVALAALAVSAGRVPAEREPAEDLRLPAFTRLVTGAGALAVLAGVLAVVGAMAAHWQLPTALEGESPYTARVLVPAGVLMLVLGGGVLWPRTARWVRPALAVAWTAVPLAAAATLDAVLTAIQAAGASAGSGAWAAGAAILLAVLAGAGAAIAGGVERDDVDLSDVAVRRPLAAPAAVAGLLAIGAFALPVVTAPGYVPPGVFTEFSTTSWGLLTGLAAVLGAAVLAPLCRPERAAALLAGAAVVVLVRVAELPLTVGRAEGAGPGTGTWLGLACTAVLLVTSALAARQVGERQQ